ncbi:MAG: hypothetical protein N4J56_006614 [Chroococcidiopsis sp. SAG 2025]|nr:reverse transcriptase N-terminal domain-containing protein [Chroococcidiopsis sp. SAG 2025]MDV2996909.1 hypothetical protein [Chroococcidiopsis sp. SAG 2025]
MECYPLAKAPEEGIKLQKRIYKASQRGDVKAVRKLQKTLLHSWSAKCLAVRRITQDNRGKKKNRRSGWRKIVVPSSTSDIGKFLKTRK